MGRSSRLGSDSPQIFAQTGAVVGSIPYVRHTGGKSSLATHRADSLSTFASEFVPDGLEEENGNNMLATPPQARYRTCVMDKMVAYTAISAAGHPSTVN